MLGAQATSPKESHGSQEEGGGAELGRREIDLIFGVEKTGVRFDDGVIVGHNRNGLYTYVCYHISTFG